MDFIAQLSQTPTHNNYHHPWLCIGVDRSVGLYKFTRGRLAHELLSKTEKSHHISGVKTNKTETDFILTSSFLGGKGGLMIAMVV